MEYKFEGSIPAEFTNGHVYVTLKGQKLDLMAVENMDDMRIVLTAITVDSMATVMSSIPDASQPQQPVKTGPDLEGYADQIRQAFQDQADKAQERLNDLAGLNAATSGNESQG